MKRLFAFSLLAGIAAFAFTACNDEAHGSKDRERSSDNSQHMPGMVAPSVYNLHYDTFHANNRTITPDSNRYIGSMVDTVHGLRDNSPRQ